MIFLVYNSKYSVSVSKIQNTRNLSNIAEQYHACIASRKKDAKSCIAKDNLNVDDTHVSSQDGLEQ